jgi:CheY-like chemotaxis protein
MIQKLPGISVIEASDGKEALQVIERENPTAVLTDMQMPQMNGLELVATVRERHAHIPVILMTAHGSEHLAIQALRAGAANYVSKKELESELIQTLQQVLAVAAMERRRQRTLSCLELREARFMLKSDPDLIGPLVELLLTDLRVMDLCDSTGRIQMGVVLLEALLNALYHGNLEVSSVLRQEDEKRFYALAEERRDITPYRDRRILVHARVDRQMARFVICDEGPGFDTSSVNRPIEPEDLSRISGRGLLLIRAFVDEMHHNSVGNEITLVKHGRHHKREA